MKVERHSGDGFLAGVETTPLRRRTTSLRKNLQCGCGRNRRPNVMIRMAVAAALTGLCWGCTSSRDEVSTSAAKAQIIFVRLTATGTNAGRVGTAVLIPQGGRTSVTIEVSGVPPNTTRPIHLYTFIYAGKCARLPSAPAYALIDRVLADSPGLPNRMIASVPPFRVSNFAPVALDVMLDSPHAVQVRTGPADGNQEIFCGEISRE